MIQHLKGYKKPGDIDPASRPMTENSTNEDFGTGMAPWDELDVAEITMDKLPLRRDANGNGSDAPEYRGDLKD